MANARDEQNAFLADIFRRLEQSCDTILALMARGRPTDEQTRATMAGVLRDMWRDANRLAVYVENNVSDRGPFAEIKEELLDKVRRINDLIPEKLDPRTGAISRRNAELLKKRERHRVLADQVSKYLAQLRADVGPSPYRFEPIRHQTPGFSSLAVEAALAVQIFAYAWQKYRQRRSAST